MASKDGKIFEDNIKSSAEHYNIYCERIKDSASSFGQDSSFTKYTVKNPYDFYFYYNGRLFTSELKSTEMTSITIQRDKKDKGKSIKKHQIEGLNRGIEFDGVLPSLILDFRKTDNTYYLRIEDFNSFLEENSKKSINEKDVVKYGGIIINKKLLQVNHRYDLPDIFSKVIKKYD